LRLKEAVARPPARSRAIHRGTGSACDGAAPANRGKASEADGIASMKRLDRHFPADPAVRAAGHRPAQHSPRFHDDRRKARMLE
jgi:hypothetical protein